MPGKDALSATVWTASIFGFTMHRQGVYATAGTSSSSRHLRSDLVSGFHEGELTYDEYDDMVRDVRNYTSNLDLPSPPAADGVVGDPSVRD